MRPWVGYGLFVGGLAAVAAGGVALYRRNRGLGYSNRAAEEAPIVGQTRAGGMTLTHRRSKNMSIEQRVATIQNLVWKSIQDPQMRKLALQITKHCPERDGACEAKAIYDYTKKHVRYTGDVAPVKMGADGPVEGIDFFQSAARTLEFGGEDCDGHAIVNSTLLALNGITAMERVTKPSRLSDWAHIYAVAGLPKLSPRKWVALDTTLPGRNNFGREVPYASKIDFPA
jgi:hypothetical protein